MKIKTARGIFSVAAIVAGMIVGTIPANTQAPPTHPPIQIHFFTVVNYETVNQLISVVDQQMKLGAKDFSILLSSPGGDPSAGFAAYTYLHGLDINLTTFNLGDVDSAANLIFCAGKQRYAMPNTRFLIHGASYGNGANPQVDIAALDAESAQIRNLNDMMATVVGSATHNRKAEIDLAIHSQKILGADEAKTWGLVQDVRQTWVVPGAVLASVENQVAKPAPAPGSGTITSISADHIVN